MSRAGETRLSTEPLDGLRGSLRLTTTVSSAGIDTRDVYHGCMSRTNVELDDVLVAEVMRRYGVSTKKAAVDLALRRLVGAPLDQDFLRGLEGVGWAGDLDAVRDERPDGFA